jgi:hypothetical protein
MSPWKDLFVASAGASAALAGLVFVAAPHHPPSVLDLDRCNTASVPTDIYFAGNITHVRVDEDPSQVAEAFTSAGGLPFRLTGQDARGDVYINPAAVTFWSASNSGPEPEAQADSPPPRTERQAVDIWGNPLRKKRRR